MIICCTVPEIQCMIDTIVINLGYFCPFTPLTTQKIKIFQKWKKHMEISSLYTCVPKLMVICYTVPEVWGMTSVIAVFHFELFLRFYPNNSKKNIFFKWRNLLQISSFYTCVPKIMIRWCKVPEIWRMTDGKTNRQMDRQTQKKWNIEVGALPKNKDIFSS